MADQKNEGLPMLIFQAVKAEEIKAIAQKYLQDNYVISLLAPEKFLITE